jgi:hypothetical protein
VKISLASSKKIWFERKPFAESNSIEVKVTSISGVREKCLPSHVEYVVTETEIINSEETAVSSCEYYEPKYSSQ